MIPSISFPYGRLGRPVVLSAFSSGATFLISFQRSSALRVLVLKNFLFLNKHYQIQQETNKPLRISFWVGSKYFDMYD
ncbi:MAG TPA: hypothetical protein VJ767_02475 [Nitrososphaeraceae archaeon]|nr:hypothetical protein [Nitrososphaeraceae archaeon]